MQKVIKYVVFKTKWGYFGLAGTEYHLWRTCLPESNPEKLKSRLVKSLPPVNRVSLVRRSLGEGGSIEYPVSSIESDKTFFKPLQQQIIAYFEGVFINFDPGILPVSLDGFSDFQRAVLTACRELRFGRIVTYGDLAKKLHRPVAARAVGNALAKNPLPLLIPCHRVIRSDGSLGGFSAAGGKNTKGRLLGHEKTTFRW